MRKIFTIAEEPRGDLYRALMAKALDFCAFFSVIVRDEMDLNSSGEGVIEHLAPHRVSTTRVSEWPGTELVGHEATRYEFSLTLGSCRVLSDAVDGLYDWEQPDRPEDLALWRPDRRLWLGSIAHERDAFLELDPEELEQLERALPQLKLLLDEEVG